ncbi:MAG: VWA domain-containing protein [Nitrospirae bacterium]|nr:MAG: VWA domain-containing protein [Nitrospirota bacterium]
MSETVLVGVIAEGDHKREVEIPLMGVEVIGDITGTAARVKIIHRFKNNEDCPLEAIYKYPLPEGAAVCGFTIKTNEKTVVGSVDEREAAFEQYDKALSEGDGAYLLDQERSNIFTLSVGNLNPKSTVTIETEYVTLLENNDNEVRFYLPTTISPRYIPDNMPDYNGIPEGERVNPEFRSHVSYGLSIKLNIHGKETITAVESPSHKIRTSFNAESIMVEFSADTVEMDKDFVLNVKHKEDSKSKAYLCVDNTGDKFLQIDLLDPDEIAGDNSDKDDNEKEIVFLLDCSGSMSGSSITEAKDALDILVKSLGDGVYFNIYKFGSEYTKLFKKSMAVNQNTRKKAIDYIAKIDADMGGTEVYDALSNIFEGTPSVENKRDVILITDGEVGNESEISELVSKHARENKLFTVGIGYGPNEQLIKETSRVSGGTYEMIAPGESVKTKMLRLLSRFTGGCVEDIKISGKKIEQTPAAAFAYKRTITTIFARIKEAEIKDEIAVNGVFKGSKVKWSIPVFAIEGIQSPISKLWAREIIREMEAKSLNENSGTKQKKRKSNIVKNKIVELSKEFGILSKHTSFIGIEQREDKDKTIEECELRKVPVMLTQGWHGIENGKFSLASPIKPSIAMMECSREAPPRDLEVIRNKLLSAYEEVMKLNIEDGSFGYDVIDGLKDSDIIKQRIDSILKQLLVEDALVESLKVFIATKIVIGLWEKGCHAKLTYYDDALNWVKEKEQGEFAFMQNNALLNELVGFVQSNEFPQFAVDSIEED